MRRIVFVVSLACLLVTGCAQDRMTTDVLTVVGEADYSFAPRVVTVPRQTPVTLTFSARGEAHSYVLKDAIKDGPIDNSRGLLTRNPTASNDLIVAEATQDETVTVTFTMLERGVYLVYCMYEGHRENGMFGTLIVE